MLTDARRGTLADSGVRSGRTFYDACTEWLRYVEYDRQRAPSTLREYRHVVNGVLLPEFGKTTPLELITTERIDEWRERLLDEGELARRTIQKNLVLLYGILKRAKRRKWIGTNPAEDVERVIGTRSGDFNVLSPVEVEALAQAALSEQHAAIFEFAAFTGLRLGELRALRWRDVDFADHNVLVRRSFANGQEGPPKSGKIRSVPLIDQAASVLHSLSERELFTAQRDLVFCSEVGDHFHDDQGLEAANGLALSFSWQTDRATRSENSYLRAMAIDGDGAVHPARSLRPCPEPRQASVQRAPIDRRLSGKSAEIR